MRKKIEWRIGITGKALEAAVPAGVKIAFGTDAGVSLHGRNADEFELMVAHGMTPATAIQAATVNAAELLGLRDEVGTLEPGKRADLIAVDGRSAGGRDRAQARRVRDEGRPRGEKHALIAVTIRPIVTTDRMRPLRARCPRSCSPPTSGLVHGRAGCCWHRA